jgi:hypothetical protein
VLPSDGDFLDYKFELNPDDFLEQAEQDYEAGGNAALLNSITNAKRAIRSQIDKVIYCLGFDATRMKIGRKMELLRETGFVAPRILRRVDNARNLLEHEYRSPSIQEVEEALDLAALFIEATNRSISPMGTTFAMGNEDEYIQNTVCDFQNRLFFAFDLDNGRFHVTGTRCTPAENRLLKVSRIPIKSDVCITNSDAMYIPILHLAVVVERNHEGKIKRAVQGFFSVLGDL